MSKESQDEQGSTAGDFLRTFGGGVAGSVGGMVAGGIIGSVVGPTGMAIGAKVGMKVGTTYGMMKGAESCKSESFRNNVENLALKR